ncbi:258_t:CDS:2 [Paraglomus brasilianum]|uniref:258_t:CDS:1 n=1 Tax=Paraglomus brasilianum TaxID=144538 RepID=A0A9N9FYG9_9GLOM|nr:258_t:CDS:2 [Paraglomus brasilianum]
MVELEEVLEDHEEAVSDEQSDSSSEGSNSDDDFEESFVERVKALRDIVPQDTRESIVGNISSVFRVGWQGATWIGKVMWVLTTSALLVVMPLALEIEREQALIQLENEQKAMQSGSPYGQPGQPSQPGQAGQPGLSTPPIGGYVPPGY